jgi:hypothetical protein
VPDIDFAFLADAAEAVPGRKFAVIGGGVSRVGGPVFPLRHPHLALVIGLAVSAAELDLEHEVRFALLGPDGRELTSGAASIRAGGPGDGRDTVVTFGIDLWNLVFEVPGPYSCRLLVDGRERKRLPIQVDRLDAPGGLTGSAIVPPFPPPTGLA